MYNGVAGGLNYYVEKGQLADITGSALSGDLKINGISQVDCFGANITSIDSPDVTYLNCADNDIEVLTLQNIYNVDAFNNKLTAKSIGDIIHKAYLEDRQNVYFSFAGGTNANATSVNSYLLATYGITLTTAMDRLTVSGTVSLNS